jgi:hypothetical protein
MARPGPARDSTRREDVAARQLIERHRGTIERLADHLSNGAYSASRRPRAEPQPDGLMIHVLGGSAAPDPPRPYVRISANDRVVLADAASGRQLAFLGEIRRVGGVRRFVVATKANGFFAALDAELAARLESLDGAALGRDRVEADLATEISDRLNLA